MESTFAMDGHRPEETVPRLALNNFKNSSAVLTAASKCRYMRAKRAILTTEVRPLGQEGQLHGPDPSGKKPALLSGLDYLQRRLEKLPSGRRVKYDGRLLRVLAPLLSEYTQHYKKGPTKFQEALKFAIKQAFDIGPRALRPGSCVSVPSTPRERLRYLADMIPLEFFEEHSDAVADQVVLGVIRFFWCYLNNSIRGSYFIPAKRYTKNKIRGSALSGPAARPPWPSQPLHSSPTHHSTDQTFDSAPGSSPNDQADENLEATVPRNARSNPRRIIGDDGKGIHPLQPAAIDSEDDSDTDSEYETDIESENDNGTDSDDTDEDSDHDTDIESNDDSEPHVPQKRKEPAHPEKSFSATGEKAAPQMKIKENPKRTTESKENLQPSLEQAKTHAKSRNNIKQSNLHGSAARPIVVDSSQDSKSIMIKREQSPLFDSNDAPYSGGLKTSSEPQQPSNLDSPSRVTPKSALHPNCPSTSSPVAKKRTLFGDDSEDSSSSESEGGDFPSGSVSQSINKRKAPAETEEPTSKRKKPDPALKTTSTIVIRQDQIENGSLNLPLHQPTSAYAGVIDLAPIKPPQPREKILNKAGKLQQRPLSRGEVIENMLNKERIKTSQYEAIFDEMGISLDMLEEMTERLSHGSTAKNAVYTVKQYYGKKNA